MPDEYEKALTHVAYEYVALESAFKVVTNPPTTPIFVAAFDSFLVHYRSLVEFFHSGTDWRIRFPDNDIRAEHYIKGWTTPLLKEWKKWEPSMHILLAHLSTKRNAVHGQGTGLDHEKHFK